MISLINGQKDYGVKNWWQLISWICQEHKKPLGGGWSDIQTRGPKIGVHGYPNQNLKTRGTN